MLRIGQFARLWRISVRTLHFYEERGLIRPSHVDPQTGYRCCSTELLPQVNRILALRDLGPSLDQRRGVLSTGRLSSASPRTMLDAKRADLEAQVRAEQAPLCRVEARLRQIEQEGTMPDYEVVIRSVPPQLVAGRRRIVPTTDQIGELLPGDVAAVIEHVQAQGGRIRGPMAEVWHDRQFTGRDMDIAMVAPIAAPIAEGETVKVHTCPARMPWPAPSARGRTSGSGTRTRR
jgi:DNA-binding transcriptional MerR regulator